MRLGCLLLTAASLMFCGCVVETTSPPASHTDQETERFSECDAVEKEAAWRNELLRLVNQERAAAGLSALTSNATLTDQATEYACEMIEYDFFGHYNPETGTRLSDRAAAFGYDYKKIGENLAAVGPKDCSPEQVLEYWMDSEAHRANILEPDFTEIGIGIRTGGTYGTYWVQEFGRPKD